MKKRLSGGSGLRQSLGGGGGSRRWKLTDSENQQRSYMLGDPLKDLCINQDATNDNNAPLSISALIRRRLLVGRAMSRSRNVSNENRHFGRTCQLLRKIEASHSLAGDLSDLPSKAGRARKFSEAVIDVLFPLTLFDDCTMNHADSAVANYHSTFELASTGFLTSVLAPAEDNSKPSETASMQESRLILGDGATVTQLHTSRPKADPLTNPFGEALSFDSSNASRATGATNGNAPVPPVLLRKNPYSTHRNESDSSLRTGLSHASTPLFASTTRTGRSSQQGLLPQDEQISTFVTCTSLQVVDEELQCYTSATATNTLDVANSGEVVQHGGDLLEVDEFRLPSQQDSSSDSGDGEDDCYVACAGVAMIPADVSHIEDDLFRLPTQSSEDENDGNDVVDALPAKPKEDARDDAFRLPTPEPSSDEEASETEELRGIDRKLNRDDVTPLSDYAAVNSVTVTEPIACTTTLRAAVQEGLAHDSSQGSVLQCTQRAAAHVRFSLDNSPEPEALLTRKNRKKRFLVIEDSPESKTEPSSTVYYAFTGGLGHVLSNTQEGDLDKDMELSYENLVCAVCQKNDLSDDDPIILCDGPGGCVRCDLSVHVSCYSAAVDLDDDAAEWRCDRCKFLHGGGEGHAIVCYLCLRPDGAIKRLTGNKWKHAICKTTSECTGLKRLRRQQVNLVLKSKPTGPARRPLLDLPSNADGSLEAAARRMKRRRQLIMRQFIDDEADASEDDITGDHEEEDDVLVIEEEEEEFAKSFINDSSQLGCTQDELDARADVATHRALDVERERMRQFATPVLNQRTREAVYSEGSDTPASGSDSMRGLGKMHFIRSVLEHHRQGGRAEDIETFYQQLEGKEVDTHDETDW